MNTCMNCHVNPTNSALCADCKIAVRAARTAANAPIWEARRIEREEATARQRAAWDRMIGTWA